MSRYSIEQFVEKTSERDHGQGFFELENERLLEIKLNGIVWMKKGAMVAYRGEMKFEREGVLEQGLGKLIKKGLTGEGAQLTKATGAGKLYLADEGKKITILQMTGDSLFVNGNDLLAIESGIQWDIKMMRKLTAIAAGGLFNVKLDGSGLIAITTHYDPITLVVTPDSPVVTDPNATVAWSGTLTPELKTDLQLKSFLGRGSGESFQMRFAGTGFVVVQPYEEVVLQHSPG